nr:MAG TPA: hypothetical protein [Caudoviricetes sp.]
MVTHPSLTATFVPAGSSWSAMTFQAAIRATVAGFIAVFLPVGLTGTILPRPRCPVNPAGRELCHQRGPGPCAP